jgi:hypothetical protein
MQNDQKALTDAFERPIRGAGLARLRQAVSNFDELMERRRGHD